MLTNVDVYNKYGDYLGDLLDGSVRVSEFEKYPMKMRVKGNNKSSEYTLKVGEKTLHLENGYHILDLAGEIVRGRRGEIIVRIFLSGEHVSTGYIYVIKGNLDLSQYRYLINDLARLVNLASQDQTVIQSDYAEFSQEFIRVYDKKLEDLHNHVTRLSGVLHEISLSPHHTINKKYMIGIKGKKEQVDFRTIRMNSKSTNLGYNKIYTYKNSECVDLYDNQFILFTFFRLKQELSSLKKDFSTKLERKVQSYNNRLIDWKNYVVIETGNEEEIQRKKYKEKQIENINKALKQLDNTIKEKQPKYEKKANEIIKTIDSRINETFLADVTLKNNFIVSPSLVLLLDPLYNRIYKQYHELQELFKLEEMERLENLLTRISIERTSKLYEYWVLLQVYLELRRMGFIDSDPSMGIQSIIDLETLKFIPGGILRLKGDPDVYRFSKTLEVNLFYEKELGRNNYRPDIYIQFLGNTSRALVLDAKYRNYGLQGAEVYDDDISIATKYKEMELPYEPEVEYEESIEASFIIHSSSEKEYLDYGSAGNANRFGAIPLVPAATQFNPTPLKRLLKMFMRMHLKLLKYCWSEAHEKPAIADKITNIDGKTKGEYKCPICDNRWWVNHCGHCGEKVMKITFSDPADNFFDIDDDLKMGSRPVLRCSTCNQGFVRKRR